MKIWTWLLALGLSTVPAISAASDSPQDAPKEIVTEDLSYDTDNINYDRPYMNNHNENCDGTGRHQNHMQYNREEKGNSSQGTRHRNKQNRGSGYGNCHGN